MWPGTTSQLTSCFVWLKILFLIVLIFRSPTYAFINKHAALTRRRNSPCYLLDQHLRGNPFRVPRGLDANGDCYFFLFVAVGETSPTVSCASQRALPLIPSTHPCRPSRTVPGSCLQTGCLAPGCRIGRQYCPEAWNLPHTAAGGGGVQRRLEDEELGQAQFVELSANIGVDSLNEFLAAGCRQCQLTKISCSSQCCASSSGAPFRGRTLYSLW